MGPTVVFCIGFLFVPNVLAKFIDSENVLENVAKCRRLYSFPEERNAVLLNQSFALSQLTDMRSLCFIKCLYQLSGFVNSLGYLRTDFVDKNVLELEYPTMNKNSSIGLAENITRVCTSSMFIDFKEACTNSVQAVECFESVLYLYNYGYLNPNDEDLLTFVFSRKMYKAALIKFQTFFSLAITGKLDSRCLEIMYSPRCGIRDTEDPSRIKRYTLYRHKWNSHQLTYKISKYTRKLDKNLTDEEISRAFNIWTSVSNLTISKSNDLKANIMIRFEKRVHGDRAPFDGPGQVLAHTFYPLPYSKTRRQNSLIHFDNAENWTAHTESGVNLYQIAVHEIGHSLGLMHSNVENSVMWPRHHGYLANFTLHADDISAMKALYGSATGT